MGHHGHDHHHGTDRLWLTILLNVIITVAQVIGGILSGSLSLLSDAAHNFSDVIALFVSYIGRKLSTRPYTDSKTFGYKRAEIIAALINVVSIILIGVFIFIEALERLKNPVSVHSGTVIGLAALSILMNGLSVLLIQKSAKDSINIRSAYLHLFSDMLTSVAVMFSGIAMALFGWYWLDTILSVAIAIYLVVTSLKMLFETLSILMLFAPKTYDSEDLVDKLKAIPEIIDVHHIHAWQLTDMDFHFEGHIVINQDFTLSESGAFKKQLKDFIKKQGFSHVTIELEYDKCIEEDCQAPSEDEHEHEDHHENHNHHNHA